MHPKIKRRATSEKTPATPLKPLLLHEVAQPTGSANPSKRGRLKPAQPASSIATHARHHVSRHTQS